MLEILALIFLCIQNGKLAVSKGQQRAPWIIYTILAWIGAEMMGIIMLGGAILGKGIFMQENLLGIMLLGLVSGFGGYLFIKYLLDKLPGSFNKEEIDRVGADDLHPPKK